MQLAERVDNAIREFDGAQNEDRRKAAWKVLGLLDDYEPKRLEQILTQKLDPRLVWQLNEYAMDPKPSERRNKHNVLAALQKVQPSIQRALRAASRAQTRQADAPRRTSASQSRPAGRQQEDRVASRASPKPAAKRSSPVSQPAAKRSSSVRPPPPPPSPARTPSGRSAELVEDTIGDEDEEDYEEEEEGQDGPAGGSAERAISVGSSPPAPAKRRPANWGSHTVPPYQLERLNFPAPLGEVRRAQNAKARKDSGGDKFDAPHIQYTSRDYVCRAVKGTGGGVACFPQLNSDLQGNSEECLRRKGKRPDRPVCTTRPKPVSKPNDVHCAAEETKNGGLKCMFAPGKAKDDKGCKMGQLGGKGPYLCLRDTGAVKALPRGIRVASKNTSVHYHYRGEDHRDHAVGKGQARFCVGKAQDANGTWACGWHREKRNGRVITKDPRCKVIKTAPFGDPQLGTRITCIKDVTNGNIGYCKRTGNTCRFQINLEKAGQHSDGCEYVGDGLCQNIYGSEEDKKKDLEIQRKAIRSFVKHKADRVCALTLQHRQSLTKEDRQYLKKVDDRLGRLAQEVHDAKGLDNLVRASCMRRPASLLRKLSPLDRAYALSFCSPKAGTGRCAPINQKAKRAIARINSGLAAQAGMLENTDVVHYIPNLLSRAESKKLKSRQVATKKRHKLPVVALG